MTADVNCVNKNISKFNNTGRKDHGATGGILSILCDEIDAMEDMKTSNILLTQHLPISDDLSKLRAEEIWLENAIRERISVR